MKTTQAHIKRDRAQTNQLPKLQLLELEQLEEVAGAPNVPVCSKCILLIRL